MKNDLFTREVKVLSFGIGVASSLLLFFLYYFLLRFGVAVDVARSIFFVCFSSYILVVAFSFRSLHRPFYSYQVFSNKKLNISILIALVILIATMAIPAKRGIFGIAPLPLSFSWLIIVWLILNVFLVEAAKWWFRSHLHRKQP